jgi:hypothetical protein
MNFIQITCRPFYCWWVEMLLKKKKKKSKKISRREIFVLFLLFLSFYSVLDVLGVHKTLLFRSSKVWQLILEEEGERERGSSSSSSSGLIQENKEQFCSVFITYFCFDSPLLFSFATQSARGRQGGREGGSSGSLGLEEKKKRGEAWEKVMGTSHGGRSTRQHGARSLRLFISSKA